jgi:hypothetical protein
VLSPGYLRLGLATQTSGTADHSVLPGAADEMLTAERLAFCCGPLNLGSTALLATTAALARSAQGSEPFPFSERARQQQRPSSAAFEIAQWSLMASGKSRSAAVSLQAQFEHKNALHFRRAGI